MIPEFLLFFIGLFPVIGTLKSSYKFVRIFPFFIGLFRRKKSKNLFSLLSIFFSFFPLLFTTCLPSLFYLSLTTTCVKGEIIQIFIIMHNYETMLVIILGNLNIYVVKLKKSENSSSPSWVRTRALVVHRIERRRLTCETIPTALRLLVTWPTA